MAYSLATTFVGAQSLTGLETTAKHPLGLIVQGRDPSLGMGEFIYLKGVGSTILGSIVNYDDNFTTALDTSATAGPSRPLAVALAACTASYYGWYQISGLAVAAKASATTFADGVGLGAGSGLAVAVATGTVIQGAIVRGVTTTTGTGAQTVSIAINRPHDPSDVS
jgi:hypothetical protein